MPTNALTVQASPRAATASASIPSIVGVGGVRRHLDCAGSDVLPRHLPLQSAHAAAERGEVHSQAREFGFQADLHGVLLLLVERSRRGGGRGVAQVVASAAEAARVLAVDLGVVAEPALHGQARRDVAPSVLVLEVVVAAPGTGVAAAGAGGGDLHRLSARP